MTFEPPRDAEDAGDLPLMCVEYAFLCDAATEHGGKVNALGIGIDHLGVSALPATHPRLALVARLVFEDAGGAAVPFVVKMVDADGRDVITPVEGRFQVEAAPGRRLEGASLLVDLANLEFTVTGPHEVQLWSAGEQITTLPLEVWRVATQ
ncbi:MAG: hypothetical protein O2822_04225 [Chloroflexi bacterium]|nr:hypothetical protein [Chloroflexota bacterium]